MTAIDSLNYEFNLTYLEMATHLVKVCVINKCENKCFFN